MPFRSQCYWQVFVAVSLLLMGIEFHNILQFVQANTSSEKGSSAQVSFGGVNSDKAIMSSIFTAPTCDDCKNEAPNVMNFGGKYFVEVPRPVNYQTGSLNRMYSGVINESSRAFGYNSVHPPFLVIKNLFFSGDAENQCKLLKRRLARVPETRILNLYYQVTRELGYDTPGVIIESIGGQSYRDTVNKPLIFEARRDCVWHVKKGDPLIKYYIICE